MGVRHQHFCGCFLCRNFHHSFIGKKAQTAANCGCPIYRVGCLEIALFQSDQDKFSAFIITSSPTNVAIAAEFLKLFPLYKASIVKEIYVHMTLRVVLFIEELTFFVYEAHSLNNLKCICLYLLLAVEFREEKLMKSRFISFLIVHIYF